LSVLALPWGDDDSLRSRSTAFRLDEEERSSASAGLLFTTQYTEVLRQRRRRLWRLVHHRSQHRIRGERCSPARDKSFLPEQGSASGPRNPSHGPRQAPESTAEGVAPRVICRCAGLVSSRGSRRNAGARKHPSRKRPGYIRLGPVWQLWGVGVARRAS
jgi:hypothetical protein